MSKTTPKVLIADDVFDSRELLKYILERLDCEVVGVAKNGIDAIRQLTMYKPDVIFLDIDIPELNGLDVLDKLRSHQAPIYPVIVSGLSTMENIKTSIEKGAKGFVVKLYKPESIEQLINRFRRDAA